LVDEVEIRNPNTRLQRASVSAEAYGTFNKKENFQPRTVPKPPQIQQRIYQRMSEAFMFNSLDEKEKEIVMLAMEEKKFQAGEWVINQGEEGNDLFVIDQGQLDCYKKYSNKPDPVHLKTYQPGESFGELALLYNAPRAASIQAKTDGVLWALDRQTFNHIVKDASVRKREKYEVFLQNWALLKVIDDPYEKLKIADILEVSEASQGQALIKLGDHLAPIFIVEEGEIAAINAQGQTKFKYGPGEYFGEIPHVFLGKQQPFSFVVQSAKAKLLKIPH
jgi:cAMP-dependent protein kinase regulator